MSLSIPELYRSLSSAQRASIIDRNHNMQSSTKEVLVRKGLIHAKTTASCVDGVFHRSSKFTDLGKEVAQYHCDKLRKNIVKQHPDHVLITNDDQLLDIFAEYVLYGVTPTIYVYRGMYALIDYDEFNINMDAENIDYGKYILDPYYRWEIEVDKTSGKFLDHATIISHKGSYGYTYNSKKGEKYVKRNTLCSTKE